jgi:hypothetical protein
MARITGQMRERALGLFRHLLMFGNGERSDGRGLVGADQLRFGTLAINAPRG